MEKFQWHADVCAFRRVLLGIEESEHTSECDPTGEWYNPAMVAEATRKYYEKYRGPYERQQARVAEEQRRRGRAINEKYAKAHGFASWDACWDAHKDRYGLATKIISWMKAEGMMKQPGERDDQ